MNKRILCTLFGHTGSERNEGYKVCSRCGEHEFYCSRDICRCYGFDEPDTDYAFQAIIFWPLWWVKSKLPFRLVPGKCADCKKRFGDHSGCIPF